MAPVGGVGVELAREAAAADHHEAAAGARAAGREDLHRQGTDGRVGDPPVPAARYPGGSTASAAPHPHPQVPSQRRHCRLVPHVSVGRHLYT